MLQLIHILLLNVSNCNTLTISFSSTNMQFFHNRISVFNLFILIFIMNHRHKTYTGSFHDIHILYFPFPLLPGSPGGHVKSRNYFDIFCIGLYFYSIIKRILNILTQDFPPVSELNSVSYTNATMLSYSLVPAASSTDDLDTRSVLAHDSLVLVSSVITGLSQTPVSQRLNCSDPDNVYLQGTVWRFYFATAEVRFMFSSSFRKLGLAFNLEYLCQFFINFNNQCQFWNPHDEQITNLSLIFKINEEITEKIGNEKDETKLIFEKYQLSLTSNISAKISSN